MTAELHEGDALEILPTLPESSVHLILTDPPYHRVKAEAWDRQWKTDADYLAWIGRLCDEWRRVLVPNGSLYVFASPKMAARVECVVGERFEVLNSIIWVKPDPSSAINYGAGNGGRMCKAAMRQFYPNTERIIFAEHFGADDKAACVGTKAFVFGELLGYFVSEFNAAGLSRREVDDHFGTANVSQYWLQQRGFIIPTADKWAGLQSIRPGYFRADYESLRRDYESLRRDYESLRRPFAVSSSVPYTDVWDFPTVPARPGKHPCEKPLAMMEHVVAASSRPGDTVLDCFMGSGVVGEACRNLGRSFIGIDGDPKWVRRARARIDAPLATAALFA